MAEPQPNACTYFREDAAYATLTLRMPLEEVDHHLRVPAHYIAIWSQPVDYGVTTAKLFNVMLDRFAPVKSWEQSALNKAGRRNDYFWFLIHDVVPFEQLLELKYQYANPGGRTSLADAQSTDDDHGLQALGPRQNAPSRDLFLGTHETEFPTIIICSRPEHSAFPICTHAVRLHDIDVEISYRRTQLADWRLYQSRVSDFLECALTS